MSDRKIELRGVGVHNLKNIDLDLPLRRLIVLCGVSGSGKTSLAFDTLYAEGQRRYIETFSTYTRQFLDCLEKPDADRIDGLPPAIAVLRKDTVKSNRSTIATATEIADYLRLLYAKIGHTFCHGCGREVRRDTPQSVADQLRKLPEGVRFQIAFPRAIPAEESRDDIVAELKQAGFVRAIFAGGTWAFGDAPNKNSPPVANSASGTPGATPALEVVVDRLVAGSGNDQRLVDSLETALRHGDGRCVVFAAQSTAEEHSVQIDGQPWQRLAFSSRLACDACAIEFPSPEPRLFSFNSPLGACPTCEGFGNVIDTDMSRVVPDPNKTLKAGAIAPWTTPAYSHELDELLALAPDYGIPVDVPYRELTPEHLQLIREGVPERNFGGLNGFFDWLERNKYKMHVRVFLSRWRTAHDCPACHGQRLKPEALATRVGSKNIADVSRLSVSAAANFFAELPLADWERQICRTILPQIESRLNYLRSVGLGYLTLDRTLRTLSDGEGQRIALTSALGSSLVNMLYVLDEPSVGLHPADVERLVRVVTGLRDRGNTVVVVEHEEEMIRAADRIVEFGPGAGERGGEVVFEGTLEEMLKSETSMTGDYLAGRRLITTPERHRQPEHGWIRLTGARGNNLKNLTVEFPLGVLCVVTGVSGAGKSTLVQDTLYGALCHRKHKECDPPYPYDDIFGDGQVDDVLLVDQSPIGRSPRSNPVTYLKIFDLIRAVFAETVEARTHNYTAGYFSFNVEGGRCETCQGDGYLEVDMQFLPDVFVKCGECGGTRYRPEILDITYRGRNIADVLNMTVREAFIFFRGQTKVQTKLKQLIDVGLDYLRLGQPANTLSAGEAQRLKLAGYMSAAGRSRTLFILDEPTTGLHFADIVQLLDCFETLLNVGHSLIVVEHNPHLMQAADYIIDLGPGAADDGGRIVAKGTPEKVSRVHESLTGQLLARLRKRG